MSYTKVTDFAAKDALLSGNPSKIVKGTEIGAEFDAIVIADALNVKGPTPATAADNSVVRWDATTGRLVQASLATIDDTGALAGVPSINSGYLYGNRVINGAQEIDQVNAGAAVTPAINGVSYLTDMFGTRTDVASKLTFQQVTDAPAGLKNSMKITVASQYSPAATEVFTFVTAIEGKDVIDFQLGTSGAATFTLSNWIKGSVAGTYSVAVWNDAANRSYIGTISVTTAWAPVKVTIAGDTTGTWRTDNGGGLVIGWDLGSGSNFNGTAGVWNASLLRRTSGSVTFVNQVAGSTLNITGVDCRLGSVAPAVFERRANELQLAQRYYFANAVQVYTAATYTNLPLPVTMRVPPTIAGGGAGFVVNIPGTTMNVCSQTTAAGANLTYSARLF